MFSEVQLTRGRCSLEPEKNQSLRVTTLRQNAFCRCSVSCLPSEAAVAGRYASVCLDTQSLVLSVVSPSAT